MFKLNIEFLQSQKVTTQEWSIKSFYVILAFIGGISRSLWYFLIAMLFSYEEFAFNNNAITSIYRASETGPEKTSPDNMEDATTNVQREVKNTGTYTYSYIEYL